MRVLATTPQMFVACLFSSVLLLPQLHGQGNSSPVATSRTGSGDQKSLVLKTEVRQVIVDVVVTTDRDKPVKSLPRNLFRLMEDGKPQEVTFFEEHNGSRAQLATKMPSEAPHVYTNFPSSPVTDSINVLLLDGLNTPMKDQAYVRQQMVSYLKSIPPGTRLAIFTLSSRLRMIQGFTADSAQLVEAIKTKKTLPRNSALLDSEGEVAQQENLGDMMKEAGMTGALASLEQFQADTQSFQTDMRVRYTLDAFQQLGRYLGGMPGRKNIIWFSGSFPLGVTPDSTLTNPFSALRNYSDDVKRTTDLLTNGQVAIYPVDARGVMTLPMFGASSQGGRYASNPGAFAQADTKFFQQTSAEHSAMEQLAKDTGGEAIYNTNGLKDAIARVIDQGANYYTLAYTPADDKKDGRFRKVLVKLDGHNYKLAYRGGYYADDSRAPLAHASALTPDPFLEIMRRGAPQATQILFRARVLPADPQPDTSDPAKRVGQDGAKLKGPVVRYLVDTAADMHNMHLTLTPDGVRHGLLRFAVVGYDEDGTALNSASSEARFTLPPAQYEQFLRTGMQLHQELDLPRGEIFLRIGVYSPQSETMGSLELPLLVRSAKPIARTTGAAAQ